MQDAAMGPLMEKVQALGESAHSQPEAQAMTQWSFHRPAKPAQATRRPSLGHRWAMNLRNDEART